jgi:hypothetical protein
MFYILMESLVGYDKQFMHNDEQRVCYTWKPISTTVTMRWQSVDIYNKTSI